MDWPIPDFDQARRRLAGEEMMRKPPPITMNMVAAEVLRIVPKPLLPGGSAEIRIPVDDFDLPLDDLTDRYLKPVAWKLACAWPHKPPSASYRRRAEAVFDGLRLIVSSNTINSARLEECFFELEKA